ncbi:putative sulfate transporter [Talaromyces proteolyticus]|uniref:Sulfate transporter n=1 Tax=Talaromyces proteolyticus TaxID=1131652 RepID=A0AAD4PTS9_9EURO|nr:putative sulfate transporter [Talaromyces proteolyticus]KAH8693863.1 putative sulfate transporter [Talaromyces proteolyticus]
MSFRAISARNLRVLRQQPLAEISGSLGDLGTFLPITIALAVNNTISLSSTLVFSGIANILTGLFFGIPLPVQPMKAIAAVAMANVFTNGEIAAAGIFVAACIFVFSVTGLLRWFSDAVPIPVVKGIQVGAGLSLIISAGTTMRTNLGWTDPSWADNRVWAILAFLFLLATNYYRNLPYALIVLPVGLVFAVILAAQHHDLPAFLLWIPALTVPVGGDWQVGVVQAGIGQLPLTTLNSVIAVTHLASDLLPDVQTPSITSIGVSVALMNLVSCWFGAMPVCHGSGGLAAQYRFGARSGSSIIFLGGLKLLIGLFFGNTLIGLLQRFPFALLGIMIIAAGLELASVGESLNTTGARDLGNNHPGILGERTQEIGPVLTEEDRKKRFTVMFVTIGFLVGFKNDAVGFIAGVLCHYSFRLPAVVHKLRERRRDGRIQLQSN